MHTCPGHAHAVPDREIAAPSQPQTERRQLMAQAQKPFDRLLRIEPGSQKAAKGVRQTDLTAYIDARPAAAVKEARQMAGGCWLVLESLGTASAAQCQPTAMRQCRPTIQAAEVGDAAKSPINCNRRQIRHRRSIHCRTNVRTHQSQHHQSRNRLTTIAAGCFWTQALRTSRAL